MFNFFKSSKMKPFGFTQKITPQQKKSAQQTIPFIECYDNGLFLVAPDTYTLVFEFENLDYLLYRDEEQKEVYNNYVKMLNSLPKGVSYQEFMMNSKVNLDKLRKTLIPPTERYGTDIYNEYCRMINDNIHKSENAASEKKLVIALSFKPEGSMENVNTIFKYYNEIKTGFQLMKSDVRILNPIEVFALFHEFYHPFDNLDFLLPNNVYKHGSSIKSYIAPSMFAFKGKECEIGNGFTRIMFVAKYDRVIDDEFISDFLDNNQRITVSKHIKHIEKAEALDKINKQILNVQDSIQRRMENNKKKGGNFVPYKYLERNKELQELQTELSESNREFFEIGVFIGISARTKEELETLTVDVRNKAARHQVKVDVLMRQQARGLNTLLPMGRNLYSVKDGNNVNNNQMSDMVGTLIPFSARSYFAETGIFYGHNRATFAAIILDRTDEMNANGFTLGASGSGKSMFTKSELFDVLMKYPNDEIIIIDPENEYLPLTKTLNGEILKISASSPTKMNIFDTDLSFTEDGADAITTKIEFIMTFCETALGHTLSSSQMSIIDRVTREVYKKFVKSGGDKEKLPTLFEFYELLIEQTENEAQDIAVALELYVKGSFSTFAGHTNVNINKKFLVIDILEMGDQLKTVGLQVILEFLWQRVIENKSRGVRTWIWVDEFSMIFNNARSAEFFAKVYKRVRKHGGVATGITQNITEILENKNAVTMLQNSQFVVILQQQKKDLEKLIDLYDLSPSQSAYLTTGERGTGLILCGKKVIPFEKPIPKDNLVYKICSTNFKEWQNEQKEQKEAVNV